MAKQKLQYYYVHKNSGDAIFVKTQEFFVAQGGRRQTWGKNWKRVRARSIAHARELGAILFQRPLRRI